MSNVRAILINMSRKLNILIGLKVYSYVKNDINKSHAYNKQY